MKKNLLLIVGLLLTFSVTYSQINFDKKEYIIGSEIRAVDIGDINNDGLNDVVVGTGKLNDELNDYHLFIFYQNIDDSLNSPIKLKYPIGYPGLKVLHIADMNNDSLNDVVIGYADSVGIYFQNKAGSLDSFESYYSGEDVDGLKSGDLNNDGLNDLAICHWNDDYLNIFYQTIEDTFNIVSYPFTSAGYDELDVKDVNADGLDDIIYKPGQLLSGALHIFYQDSIQGITDSVNTFFYEYESRHTFNGIGSGDLNNDNKIDIVGSIGGNTAAIVLLQQDTVNNIYSNPIQIPAYDIPIPVEINDLNCDNNNEIIVGHSGWNSVTIYEKNSMGDFGDYLRFTASQYYKPYSLATGDINNDNKIDVVTVSYSKVVFLYNNSKPTSFELIDTIYRADTIISQQDTSEYRIKQISSVSTIDNAIIYQIDSLNIISYYTNGNIANDTMFIREGEFCKKMYIDTIFSRQEDHFFSMIENDTIIFYSSNDTISTVNIGKDIEKNEIQLFPNPAHDYFYFLLPNSGSINKCHIEILTLDGKVLLIRDEVVVNKSKVPIKITELKSGIYIIKINFGETTVIKKLIKN